MSIANFLFSLSFSSLGASFLGVFSLAGSFRCFFSLLFLGALYVAWVLFHVGLFSVRTFFFAKPTLMLHFTCTVHWKKK
jgi:hypothetical protein